MFLIAFGVIGILTIIEGVTDGFTFLNWVVLAVSVVFGTQAALSLTGEGSTIDLPDPHAPRRQVHRR